MQCLFDKGCASRKQAAEMLMKSGKTGSGLLVVLVDFESLEFVDLDGLVGQVLFRCIVEISVVTRAGIGRAVLAGAANT